MSLERDCLGIAELIYLKPRRFHDDRGYFSETYKMPAFRDAGVSATFVQDNEALSRDAGVLRGLHFQLAPNPQAKLVRVIRGAIFDVAVDLRAGSETFGKWCGRTLSGEAGDQLFVPRGFAHGYVTLEPDTLVAYKVDGYYDKSAEGGIRWDDPAIAIDWPFDRNKIKVSEKDAELPFLSDISHTLDFGAP